MGLLACSLHQALPLSIVGKDTLVHLSEEAGKNPPQETFVKCDFSSK
jgi:hypothetical protein